MAIGQAFASCSTAQALLGPANMGPRAPPGRTGIALTRVESPKQPWSRRSAVCAPPFYFPQPIILQAPCLLPARNQEKEKPPLPPTWRDRKSTRLNSSHRCISYAVFCLKKKKNNKKI